MAALKNFKLIGIFLFIFTLAGLVSCNKKSDQTSDQKVNEADLETVSTKDFTESDEDLLSVDYKEFYDELAPHGEWIEVKENEIGVDLKKNTSAGHRTISISDLFGVKDAYADVDFGAFFVWQPAPGLAVGLTTGETDVAVTPAYVPYSNGQWINTTNGWYFKAASEPEEITHHYGRWVNSPSLGWVWLPGRVWSPAWVDWREQDDYVAWEPVPPSFYLVNNVVAPPPVYVDRYIVVEKRYFIEPEIYRHVYVGPSLTITEWRRPEGVMVVNQTVINRGPDVSVIQTYYGTPIGLVTINPVTSISQVSYTSAEYRVFTPEFKKVKTKIKVNKVISTPKKFDKFESASGKYESGKQNKGNNKTDQGNVKGNENKNSKKNENFKENRKYIDDGKMKDGGKTKDNGNNKNNNNNTQKKDNGKKNDGNKNDGKKNDGNKNDGKKDGGNKEKIDKKGNDNKSNDNGKSNGKDNKGKKFSKDQNKGNDQNKVKGQDKSGNNDNSNKNNGSEKKQNNGSKNKGNKK